MRPVADDHLDWDRLTAFLWAGTIGEHGVAMAPSSKLMIWEAEYRLPVRIRLALPAGGFGTRLTSIHEWLDQNAGADGWAMTPSGTRSVVNDAVAVYFADATILLASAGSAARP